MDTFKDNIALDTLEGQEQRFSMVSKPTREGAANSRAGGAVS